MNFIVKLPLSKEVFTGVTYNLILIIINRLIKYVYFISYKKVLTIEELIYIFNRNVIVNYEILKEIINDRDRLLAGTRLARPVRVGNPPRLGRVRVLGNPNPNGSGKNFQNPTREVRGGPESNGLGSNPSPFTKYSIF